MPMPAAQITSMQVCPMVTPPGIPHVGGPIALGAPTVLMGKMPVAQIGNIAVCVGPPSATAFGSPTVLAAKKPVTRMLDPTAHGGVVMIGAPTVLVGP